MWYTWLEGVVNFLDNELKRSIILDNYQNSYHRERREDTLYDKINSRNVSCIDNIDVYVKVEDGIIKELYFDGEACVISISSTSIMCRLLEGKTIDEAIEIIKNYDNMIEEKEFDRDILEEALAYYDVAKQPSRKTCATLTWHGLYKKLLELKRSL